jgi:hypothetical protein
MSVPPSRLSLLGLVRHMTEMERSYIRNCVGGEHLRYRYCTDDDPDGDFEGVAAADPAADLAEWRETQARSDVAIATMGDADAICPDGRTLRWYVLKVIGEYSRHNGHADLLRETIDGATGE